MHRLHLILRRSLLGALVWSAGAGSLLSAQDFEGIITAKIKGMSGDMKTYVKGNKTRMEMTVQGQGSIAIIPDAAAGETYMVMPAQSIYMVIKMSDAERLADSLIRRKAPAGDASVTATGRKEQIIGHSCEYYRIRDTKSVTDVCLTTELGVLRGGVSMFVPPARGRPSDPPAWAREM